MADETENPQPALPVEYDDPEAHLTHELSPEEKALVQNISVYGMDYLRVMKQWRLVQVREFLSRREVMRHLEYLQRQYLDRGGVQERVQFYGQLQVNGLVAPALSVLARALAGTVVDQETGAVRQRAPDRGQMDAAVEILTRANIQGGKFAGNPSVPAIDANSVATSITAAAGISGLSAKGRSKVAKLLTKVATRLQAGEDAETRVNARRAEKPAVLDDDAPAITAPEEAVTVDLQRPVAAAVPRRRAPPEDPRDRG